LRARIQPLGALAEPEGHMVADKRADITVAMPGKKLILELKRDTHPELWDAPTEQLDRFYTRDPEASGYGVYVVFWYGVNRKRGIPRRPDGGDQPKSAEALEKALGEMMSSKGQTKLLPVVIDVSIPDGQRAGGSNRRGRANGRRSATASSESKRQLNSTKKKRS